MSAYRIIGTLAALFALACGTAAADDAAHPMGYFPSPKGGIKVRRANVQKTRTQLAAKRDAIPGRWDAREKGWVTPVKDQLDLGNCWAFAACAAIESNLLKTGRGEWNFSEKNVVNLNGWDLPLPDRLKGGFSGMAEAYMVRWTGPVAETNDAYRGTEASWTESPPLAPLFHVQNVVWVEALDGSEESRNRVKSAIMEYGALSVSMYYASGYFKSSGSAYRCNVTATPNHAVALVGWDDGFPADKFGNPPPGPGAWIVKNSWGLDWGDSGYFYVSFYDSMFGRETSQAYLVADEGERYDAVRGYDCGGAVFDAAANYSAVRSEHDLQASVFTATWNERLDAVGVWTEVYPKPYEISVYTNVTRGAATPTAGGVLALRQTGVVERPGFTTIRLESPLALADGDGFAVVYRQTGDEPLSNLVNCFYPDLYSPDHRKGNSYFGYYPTNGVLSLENAAWFDGKTIVEDDAGHVDPVDVSWAACLKAYTSSIRRASAGDAPSESESGAAYLAGLESDSEAFYLETSKTFGSSFGLTGANGRTLWASWLAGFDPSSPCDSKLVLSIAVSNNVPRLSWTPDLGEDRRYTVFGRATLEPSHAWTPVDRDNLSTSGARFFRVSVGQ